MLRKLMLTDNTTATAVMRVVLGIDFFSRCSKAAGLVGGYGFTGTMASFAGALHIPPLLAFLAIVAEFFGGLGIIFGPLTRVAAFAIAVKMLVAIAMVHSRFGFFMNWSGEQKGEEFEYHLLVFAMAAFLMIKGARGASIDQKVRPAPNG